MNVIKTITEEAFGRKSTPEKWVKYRVRQGARAILLDKESKIALMHVTKQNYYKLPGGGIDPGESKHEALRREILEEVGAAQIEILSEIGEVDGYRDEWEMKAEHFCYLAKLTGAIGKPSRTDKEIENGYETVWVENIDEAIKLVESSQPDEYGKGFEIYRELAVLNKAKDILHK